MTKQALWTRWLVETIESMVLDAPENRLPDFEGQPIFGRPLVGVADGDDPLFARFKHVVFSRHLMPRELLKRNVSGLQDIDLIRVVVWAMPFTQAVRASNCGKDWPSALYSVARNGAAALIHGVSRRLAEVLRGMGWAAVVPWLTSEYDAFHCPTHVYSSSWSERHAAFAAGLGQFGLSAALITPVGSHVRFGSIVTTLPVLVTPRTSDEYRAPCLRDGGATCGACIRRCPVAAISSDGLAKTRCRSMREAVRRRFLEEYLNRFHLLPAPVIKGGTRELSYSLGCALCECGVPCEGRAP